MSHNNLITKTRSMFSNTKGSSTHGPEVRVASYNVLAPDIGTPQEHPHCRPADLEPNSRFTRILKKIQPEMDQNAIICLQELDSNWAQKLQDFFQVFNEHGKKKGRSKHMKEYTFISSCYHAPGNGQRGIGMAIPTNVYEILDQKIERVSDTCYWPGEENYKRNITPESKFLASNEFSNKIGLAKKQVQTAIWVQLETKNIHHQSRNPSLNNALMKSFNSNPKSKLNNDDIDYQKSFCVATYHMPCIFYEPIVMTMHAFLFASWAQQQAKLAACNEEPLIIAGDFNAVPNSDIYSLFTEGETASDDHNDVMELMKNNLKEFNLDIDPVRSAYRESLGVEPEFSNCSWNQHATQSFIATLDYIFISKDWDVKAVKKLMPRNKLKRSALPDEHEPSDHLMIAATLILRV